MMQAMLSGVTTEVIQQYLDENKQLILAILQYRNAGREAECAQYEAKLQRNLQFLAAVADNQAYLQATFQNPPMPPPQPMPYQQSQCRVPQSIMVAPSFVIYAPQQQQPTPPPRAHPDFYSQLMADSGVNGEFRGQAQRASGRTEARFFLKG
ncbi:uncharacterized protein A4U43_C08F8720 [Asparagus officinalis]|nr:uncharacterized protein A4U43_C08F8720 [Asparagus officinalis]